MGHLGIGKREAREASVALLLKATQEEIDETNQDPYAKVY